MAPRKTKLPLPRNGMALLPSTRISSNASSRPREAPLLAPDQYWRVFAEISFEIKAGCNTLGDIARVARDTLQSNAHNIARGKISSILKDALLGGPKLHAKLTHVDRLGFLFCNPLV